MADAAGGGPEPDHGVYSISVAAELSGVAVQSLRLYERNGLLTPTRSEGGTRRYSADDLARLRRISALVDAGVNLPGSRASSTSRMTTRNCPGLTPICAPRTAACAMPRRSDLLGTDFRCLAAQ